MNIGDIVERDTGSAEPPQPKNKNPKPRKSLFSQKSTQRPAAKPRQIAKQAPLNDAEKIHLENIKHLASMSQQDVVAEKEELINSVDPQVLASLLRRAELKESQAVSEAPPPHAASNLSDTNEPKDKPQTPMPEDHATPDSNEQKQPHSDEKLPERTYGPEDAPLVPPNNLEHPQRNPQKHLAPHFPPPPEELKEYFSDLPVETDKLAWMRPIDEVDEAEYNAEMVSIAPSELRFDFRGDLITPRMSRYIRTDEGLHHHGDAPSAAGYTLAELAHLGRSSNPAQRSLALRTAGRVLHKLRVGKFNKSTDLQGGLEAIVDQTRILDSINEAVADRNLTVRTVATEAAWLAQAEHSLKQ